MPALGRSSAHSRARGLSQGASAASTQWASPHLLGHGPPLPSCPPGPRRGARHPRGARPQPRAQQEANNGGSSSSGNTPQPPPLAKPDRSGGSGSRGGTGHTRGAPKPDGSARLSAGLGKHRMDPQSERPPGSPRPRRQCEGTAGRGHPGEERPGARAGPGRHPGSRLHPPRAAPGLRLPRSPSWPPPGSPGRGRNRARSSRRPSPSSCSSGSECELGAAARGSALSARAALNPLRSGAAGARSPAAALLLPSPAPAALTRGAPERSPAPPRRPRGASSGRPRAVGAQSPARRGHRAPRRLARPGPQLAGGARTDLTSGLRNLNSP